MSVATAANSASQASRRRAKATQRSSSQSILRGISPPTSSANRFWQCWQKQSDGQKVMSNRSPSKSNDLADLGDERAHVLAIGRVGAEHAVAAPFALRLAVVGDHPPLGMLVGGTSGRRSGWCRSLRRCRARGSVDHFAQDVAPLEPAMLLADLGRIVEQPDVRLAVGHDRSGPELSPASRRSDRRRTAKGTAHPNRGCACR